MRLRMHYLLGLFLMTTVVSTSWALEVDRKVAPRLTVAGRLLATPTVVRDEGVSPAADTSANEIDISDAALLLRLDKRLYNGKAVAGGVLGATKADQDSDLPDEVYFHQLHVFMWSERYTLRLGRMRLTNTLIEFPTLRDDDLIEYTHAANGSSLASNEPYQLYGDQIALDWYRPDLKTALSLWAASRVETDAAGTRLGEAGINSGGLGVRYDAPETMRYVSPMHRAGLLFDYQSIDGLIGDDDILAVIVGADLGLNEDPSRHWSLAVQGMIVDGIDGAGITTVEGRRRESSWSVALALRLTERPQLLTRAQSAISLAWKEFPDQGGASQWSLVPSMRWRLGQGIDAVAQYRLTDYDAAFAAATGVAREQSVQLGLIFGLDQVFNDTIGERQSLVNLEHGYLP